MSLEAVRLRGTSGGQAPVAETRRGRYCLRPPLSAGGRPGQWRHRGLRPAWLDETCPAPGPLGPELPDRCRVAARHSDGMMRRLEDRLFDNAEIDEILQNIEGEYVVLVGG